MNKKETQLDFFDRQLDGVEIDNSFIPDEVSEDVQQGISVYEQVIWEKKLESDEDPYQMLVAGFAYTLAKFTGQTQAFYYMNQRNQEVLFPFYMHVDETKKVTEVLKDTKDYIQKMQDMEAVSVEKISKRYEIQNNIWFYYYDDKEKNMQPCNQIDSEKKEEVRFFIYKNGTQYTIQIYYSESKYQEETMRRFIRFFHQILSEMCQKETLQDFYFLTEEDRQELDAFNKTEMEVDESKTIVDFFLQQVEKQPDQLAVVYKEKSYTYQEVERISGNIASYVQQMGIKKEQVVSILIPRCEYMMLASLGVMRSGAAYQPLDPSYPSERLGYMMKDADTQLLIVDKDLLSMVSDYQGSVITLEELASLPEAKPEESKKPTPDDLMILLYTSGSTGVPKGCMLEHKNVAAFSLYYQNFFDLKKGEKVGAYASYGFDANMMDLYPALIGGATVYIVEEAIRLDLAALNTYFLKEGITHAFMTTQIGRAFATSVKNDTLKYLLAGGEKLVPFVPKQGADFYNMYGPTESTVCITSFKVEEAMKDIPIGKTLPNIKVYIIDAQKRRLPVGVPGELCVAGRQVSRGYLNHPEKTAESYEQNPFSQQKGYERIYHTGDVIRYLSDGNLAFIGRRDGQVKIRGFRVELTEVEGIIRDYAPVKDATVVAYEDPAGGKYIAAYVVADEKINIEEMNQFIRENKPPYMVPAVTMQIQRIPLNQNYKVNKRMLPVPTRQTTSLVMPQNETQQKIYDCIAEILGHKEFGIHTTLDEAGLTSIGAVELNLVLANVFDVIIKNKDLQIYNTVEKLETFFLHAKKTVAYEKQESYPLTKTQSGIFVECMSKENSTVYNLPFIFKLSDKVDLTRLKMALEQTIDAHAYLKTTLFIDEDGNVLQKRNDDLCFEVPISYEWNPEQLVQPFSLIGNSLIRAGLYKTDKNQYLFLDFHHLVFDGTSYVIFIEDVNKVYNGEAIEVETYTGFEVALEEERMLKTSALNEAKAYYDQLFLNCDTEFLPAKDKKEAEEIGKNYEVLKKLDKEALQKFCEENKITMNVLFTAAFGVVVGKYVYKDEAIFSSIYHGRNDARLDRTVAMLVKTLPVHCQLDGEQNVGEYLRQTKEQLMNSMANDLFSFADISRTYGIRSDILFAYQGDSFSIETMGKEPCVVEEMTSSQAMAPIAVNVFIREGAFSFEVNYRGDWYSEETIAGMIDSFAEAIMSMCHVSQLKEVSILSKEAKQQIACFNETEVDVEPVTANVLFEQQAQWHPDRLAVIAGNQELTFKELNETANQVANYLIFMGLQAEQMVALLMPRGAYVYAVRQGILKAGGAFLPLVPEYPDERISYIMEDSNVPFLIMPKKLAEERKELLMQTTAKILILEELLQHPNKENPGLSIRPDQLCYCIYTSGSTGKPKGVMIEHRNLVNYVHDNPYNKEVGAYNNNRNVSLAMASISFDLSIFEECICLYNGTTVCMALEEEIYNPVALAKLILLRGVDVLSCTPSYIMNIIDMPEVKPALMQIKTFMIGAEAFPSVLYKKIVALGTNPIILNGYGPTETTIACAFEELKGNKITIGKPIANTKLLMVDKWQNVLPVGVPGEMLILGAGVGRGYVGKEELTKEKFFTNQGLPTYRSGDLARWNREGKIEFLGRIDNQVKLRGLRVELDEIENVLNQYPGVNSSVVVVKEQNSIQFLCAYFTADIQIEQSNLICFMQKYLTEYMVPGVLIQLETLPLTSNGKVDKKALPDPKFQQEKREYVKPETELEQQICDAFEKALEMDGVGITDNFFDIGGTSLSALKVVMKCMSLGYAVSYSDLYTYATVQQLETFLLEKKEKDTQKKETRSQEVAKETIEQEFQEILNCNVCEMIPEIKKEPMGTVLLTGATGFLGAHVLHELVENSDELIYCLLRSSDGVPIENRLKRMMVYYFDKSYDELIGTRLHLIEGDITDKNLEEILHPYTFDKICNCAACVKHFAADDILKRVNVEGVENLIKICQQRDYELIHVSTVSVAGENIDGKFPREKVIHENEFSFGQSTSNQYIDTKFRAERAVLQAISEGMKGKIMRVGNLMSREADGEFQINSVTNGFMRTIRGYAALGVFPISELDTPTEFSPIDQTAAAIVRLSATSSSCCVFHPYSSYMIQMADAVEQMNRCGIPMKVVEDEVFEQHLKEALTDEKHGDFIAGLITYLSSDQGHTMVEIGADNRFTTKVLYRLGFKWSMPDERYLYRSIDALNTLGFFDLDVK